MLFFVCMCTYVCGEGGGVVNEFQRDRAAKI